MKEELDDVVEELADKMAIYGSCDATPGKECDGSGYCCRTAFTFTIKVRIREAIKVEAILTYEEFIARIHKLL